MEIQHISVYILVNAIHDVDYNPKIQNNQLHEQKQQHTVYFNIGFYFILHQLWICNHKRDTIRHIGKSRRRIQKAITRRKSLRSVAHHVLVEQQLDQNRL